MVNYCVYVTAGQKAADCAQNGSLYKFPCMIETVFCFASRCAWMPIKSFFAQSMQVAMCSYAHAITLARERAVLAIALEATPSIVPSIVPPYIA